LRYAGLWIRGLALLLDWLVFCAAFFPITRVVKGVWLMRASDHRWTHGHFVFDPLCLYFLLVIIAYFVFLEGLFGATLGKMVVRIRVVAPDGEPIGMAKSIVRNALRLVDGLPALNLVGIVLILTSPQKARFGDRVARTRVVWSRGLVRES
ncbi:MAG: RDD family protein, partial [Planctomycetota bacterium]